LVRLHKKKPGRAQSRRGRGGKKASEPRMDTVGKPAGVGPRIAPLLGVYKGPLLETGTPSGTRGAKATAIARMRLRFRGSRIFRFDLLTGLEPHERSAGHRPGQLASKRIPRAGSETGAPVRRDPGLGNAPKCHGDMVVCGGYNPFRVEDVYGSLTQGSSFLATLGWMRQSFQD